MPGNKGAIREGRDTLIPTIGAHVQLLRKVSGLKPEVVAKQCGFSTRAYNLLEEGKLKNLTIHQLLALSRYFCVSVELLASGAGPMNA